LTKIEKFKSATTALKFGSQGFSTMPNLMVNLVFASDCKISAKSLRDPPKFENNSIIGATALKCGSQGFSTMLNLMGNLVFASDFKMWAKSLRDPKNLTNTFGVIAVKRRFALE
jgi:hypothetical protein